MEFSNDILTIFFPAWTLVLAGALLSWLITYKSIPSIIAVAKARELNGKPNGRSSHKENIPLLGGVAVFAGLILSTVIIAGVGFVHELKYIIAGLIILFFIGVKDDILVIDPKKKLVGQVMASLLIIILGNIRISNFHSFAGIYEVGYLFSILVTLFVFIVIINGFNLIDGIDGLAAGVGILTSLVFGAWFWISGHIPYVVLSVSLAGSLVAFFYFNVFSKKNKIFLGDTGSLIIGMTMAVIAVRFLQFEVFAKGPAVLPSTSGVAIGVLIIPLFDTLRVFIIRIFNGKSPFIADRKHIHHLLLDLGCSHLKATSISLGVNILFVIVVLIMRNAGNVAIFSTLLALAISLSFLPVFLIRRKQRQFIIENRELYIEHNILINEKYSVIGEQCQVNEPAKRRAKSEERRAVHVER